MPKKENKDSTLLDEIKSEVADSKAQTETWAVKHDKFYRLRFRVKKTKTFPFTGCSNLRLPTIETLIRKTKAALVGIYANIKPRMQVIPQTDTNLQKANKIERFLDYLADYKVKLLGKLILGCDKMLEKGFALLKITWSMKSRDYTEKIDLKDIELKDAMQLFDTNIPDEMVVQEFVRRYNVDMSETVVEDNMQAVQKAVQDIRSGKDNIELKLRDELYNAPEVFVCDPGDIYVPSDSGINVQDLRWICHEYFEPFEIIKQRAEEGIYDVDSINEIVNLKNLRENEDTSSSKDNDKIDEASKSQREGVDRVNNPSHLVKIWEVYKYHNPDEDTHEQKWQFIIAPEFSLMLKKQVCPYDHQKFPFVRFSTEVVDDRWFSPRGYPEHLEDISKEIDAQHNQKLDSQTIRNAPMFKFRSGMVNPKLVRFIPAQGVPVQGMQPLDDTLKMMDNSNANVDFSYEREEMLLKTVIQEYLGQVDYSLQSMINKRQPRTLGEVQMQAQNANQSFSLDSTMWTESLSEVFSQILELCQQYMPERVFALVTGKDDPQPLHMTRDEIQGRYQIVCRGNDTNTNPYVQAQKSQMRVQMLVNEVPIQMGVVNPMNVYNTFKRYLQDDGEIAWKELISQPPPPQPPQPPPAGTIVQPDFEQLTPKEQAQVLISIGIQPDGEGRMRERVSDGNEILMESEMNEHTKKMDIAKLLMEDKHAEAKEGIEKTKANSKNTVKKGT